MDSQYIRTKRLAQQIDMLPASVRTAYWRKGHYCGVIPVKAPNGQLLWPADAAERIASGKREGA